MRVETAGGRGVDPAGGAIRDVPSEVTAAADDGLGPGAGGDSGGLGTGAEGDSGGLGTGAEGDSGGLGCVGGWLTLSGWEVGPGVDGVGILIGTGGEPDGVFEPGPGVGSAEVDLGVVRPKARASAIGGSNTPRTSDTQVAHAGSNLVTCGGNDNCGVQMLVSGVP